MLALRVMKGATILSLCLLLASAVAGCTAIGFAVGAQADSRNGHGGPELLMKLKTGQPVTLFLHDGRRIAGRFSGWENGSDVASPAADSLRPRVKLESAGGEVTIRPEEVARVSFPVYRGKVTGLLVGAFVDALAALSFYLFFEMVVPGSLGN